MKIMSRIDELNRKMGQLLKEPDNAKRYNAVGVLLYGVRDWDNAERFLGRAHALDPADIDILFNYAAVLYRRRDYQKAADLCREGLKIAPDDEALLEKLGDCCYMLGVYHEATRAYENIRMSDEVGLP
jgi:tetratricopeptide (TPR) repeat protein